MTDFIQAMKSPLGWMAAVAVVALYVISSSLNGPDDIEAAQDQSDDLTELQAAAPDSQRQQVAAQRALATAEVQP